MNDESAVSRLQSVVRTSDLDGWLLYDFRGLNPFPAQLLRLGPGILTRRWFLYVPAQGLATLIHHRIEAGSWQHVLPDETIERKVFASHEQLDEVLRETLKGAQRIAMEYSSRGEVPYVSTVDAGTVERVRACGVEVVSSGDLLQHFLTWSVEDRSAHDDAVNSVIRAKDLAFQLIDERLKARRCVTELEVQELIIQQLHAAGLEFDHAPIVAFGEHASDGHYAPSPQTDRALEAGQCVLIDLWAGFRDRPMADITWVGFAGEPTAEYLRVWEAVRDARDLALHLLTTKAVQAGWEVDRAARALITARGYGAAFRHRLGHSLGRNAPHGPSVNLDDWETHDTRRLLPGLAVTVEPGVYLEHIGIRSEVNVLITETGATVTTPTQQKPYRLGN
ncbi:MAG: aminopeptidase P family protein [Chloroflexi bacterium]|nr:aminopeptidase P family protein [Chloroflexota bacterium]